MPPISWSRGWCSARCSVGARRGYVYIRHEYFEQIHAVEAEIRRARALGVVGPDVLGTGQAFELEVFESPGGYVCGEQSALIEAIEEHRAEPRNRPPVIEANGLYNQPTLLNNVETFAWVPAIVLNGGAWYRDSGVADTPWYVARRQARRQAGAVAARARGCGSSRSVATWPGRAFTRCPSARPSAS